MEIRKVIEQWRHFGEDKAGYVSDDTSYSDFAIYDQLVMSRATIVKDRARPDYFTEIMFQTLPCVMLDEVDANECGLIPKSGCYILKSTCEVPNTLKITSISKQLGQNIDYVRWDRVQGKLNSRIESIREEPYYSIRTIGDKQYLYVFNHSHLKNVVITGIFEDPVIAAQFCEDKEALCNPLAVDFHTDYKLIDPILKLTWDSVLKVRNAAKEDRLNDDYGT